MITAAKMHGLQLPPEHCTQSVKSTDVIAQADALPYWQQDYTQLSVGSFTGSIDSLSMPNLQVFRETMNRAVDEQAQPPQGTYLIGVPSIVQGSSHWNSCDVPRDAVISLDVGASLSFRTAEVSEISAAVIRSNVIEAYAETVEELDWRALLRARAPVEPITVYRAERMRAQFAEVLARSPQAMEEAMKRGPSGYSALELDILALCVNTMATPPEHTPIRQCKVQRYIVDRVRDCILEKPDDPPDIPELCLRLQISRRTLNQTFQQALGTSPVVYARSVRLNRVRRELLGASLGDVSVSQVASKWGFDHLSLFSRYYFSQFGELPSTTLKRESY